MQETEKAAFLEKLAGALDVELDALHDGFQLTSENWDSVAQLGAIAAIDEVYGIDVPTNELIECTSVRALLQLVQRLVAEG